MRRTQPFEAEKAGEVDVKRIRKYVTGGIGQGATRFGSAYSSMSGCRVALQRESLSAERPVTRDMRVDLLPSVTAKKKLVVA